MIITTELSEFKTLEQWKIDNPTADIYENFDPVTEALVDDYFRYRRVCDNHKFGFYFKRTYNNVKLQYESLMKIEAIEFNPLLTNIESTGSGAHFKKTTSSTTTTSGTNSSTTESEGESHEVTDGESTIGVSSTVTDVLSSDTAVNFTGNEITNLDSDTTSSVGTDSTVTTDMSTSTSEDTTELHKHKQLNGQMADSSTYGTGMPASLNWKYGSGQQESEDDNSTSTERTQADTGTVETATDTTSTGTVDSTTDVETTNFTSTSIDSSDTVTTTSDTTHTTDTDVTVTNNNLTTVSGTNTNAAESSETDEHCEKSATNRVAQGESAQDLLERAKRFIINTNAIKWLFNELEICFINVYE